MAGRVTKGTFTQVGARVHGARRLRPGTSHKKRCVRGLLKARWPQVSLDSWFPIFSPPPRFGGRRLVALEAPGTSVRGSWGLLT